MIVSEWWWTNDDAELPDYRCDESWDELALRLPGTASPDLHEPHKGTSIFLLPKVEIWDSVGQAINVKLAENVNGRVRNRAT